MEGIVLFFIILLVTYGVTTMMDNVQSGRHFMTRGNEHDTFSKQKTDVLLAHRNKELESVTQNAAREREDLQAKCEREMAVLKAASLQHSPLSNDAGSCSNFHGKECQRTIAHKTFAECLQNLSWQALNIFTHSGDLVFWRRRQVSVGHCGVTMGKW